MKPTTTQIRQAAENTIEAPRNHAPAVRQAIENDHRAAIIRREAGAVRLRGGDMTSPTTKRILQAAPYTRELAPLIARADFSGTWGASPDGKNCTLWLLVGADAWNVAKAWREDRRLVTLLPPGSDPCEIRWQILAGRDPVLLFRCGCVDGATVEGLLRAVMAAGVRRVLDISTGVRYVAG